MSRAYHLAAYAAGIVLAASVVLTASPASAQSAAPGGRHHGGSQAQQPQSPIATPTSTTRATLESWPRLDPGAVLCDSAEDLQQRAKALDAALDGHNRPVMTPGCTMLQARTPVDVLDRSTLGSTQVRVRSSGATGWTDVWLPDRPPTG